MANGITFDMGGPMVQGTWYNPQTGDSFTVRDSFFQDGQLLVQATDGRMFDYNILQNYVQSDKPIPPQPKKPAKREIPKEVLGELETANDIDGLLPEDAALINPDLRGVVDVDDAILHLPSKSNKVVTKTEPVKSDDEKMVDRVLQRATQPKVSYKLSWDKFPIRQMEMLIDFMGIDPELVINYYISKLDINEIKEEIGNLILKHIHGELDKEAKEVKPKTKKETK